jgi:hypothetical protein
VSVEMNGTVCCSRLGRRQEAAPWEKVSVVRRLLCGSNLPQSSNEGFGGVCNEDENGQPLTHLNPSRQGSAREWHQWVMKLLALIDAASSVEQPPGKADILSQAL